MGDCAIGVHWRNIVAECAKWCNFPTGWTSVLTLARSDFAVHRGDEGKARGLFGVDGILKRKKARQV